MARLIFTEEAKQDLIAIRQYTKKVWGNNQANTYLNDLRTTMRHLLDAPLLGTNREDDLGKGLLSFPQESHMIYYSVSGDDLIVMAILHQSMVPALHLSGGRV
jgi:toxin ParE1/3/4